MDAEGKKNGAVSSFGYLCLCYRGPCERGSYGPLKEVRPEEGGLPGLGPWGLQHSGGQGLLEVPSRDPQLHACSMPCPEASCRLRRAVDGAQGPEPIGC